MNTCSNCTADAYFQYAISASSNLYYCVAHLPKFLSSKNPSSLLVSKVEAPVTKKTVTKAVAEPTEDAVEETDGAS